MTKSRGISKLETETGNVTITSVIAKAIFRKYIKILREFLVVRKLYFVPRRMLGTFERNRCGLLHGMFLNHTVVTDVQSSIDIRL